MDEVRISAWRSAVPQLESPALITWLGIGGRCLTLGYVYPEANFSVDAHQIVTKCVTLRGIHNYHYTMLGKSVDFVAENRTRYPFAELIGETYQLADINTAFEQAFHQEALRIAIAPEE